MVCDYKLIRVGKYWDAKVSPCDYEGLRKFVWSFKRDRLSENGEEGYAYRTVRLPNGKRTSLYMHREIVKPKPGLVVDHINGDGLDNRRENLRVCSVAENARNRACGAISGFRGVSPSGMRRWRSRIAFRGEQIHLGTFSSPEEAARAYDEAALRLFGEFATINFPRERHIGRTIMPDDPPF